MASDDMLPVDTVIRQMVETQCIWCESFPCRCQANRVTTDCVCGGRLVALSGTELSKHDAVVRHNASPMHRAWRETGAGTIPGVDLTVDGQRESGRGADTTPARPPSYREGTW